MTWMLYRLGYYIILPSMKHSYVPTSILILFIVCDRIYKLHYFPITWIQYFSSHNSYVIIRLRYIHTKLIRYVVSLRCCLAAEVFEEGALLGPRVDHSRFLAHSSKGRVCVFMWASGPRRACPSQARSCLTSTGRVQRCCFVCVGSVGGHTRCRLAPVHNALKVSNIHEIYFIRKLIKSFPGFIILFLILATILMGFRLSHKCPALKFI